MKKSKLFLILIIIVIIVLIAILAVLMNTGIIPGFEENAEANKKKDRIKRNSLGQIDDWCYDPKDSEYDNYRGTMQTNSGAKYMTVDSAAVAMEDSTIGYSVGGAKDINNFRENINEGYFPLETDITYEGVYYDYSFDTGNKEVVYNDKMFYPTYSTAISKDPISGEKEYFVSVGLNSNIKESDFSRKKLNLVLVLDISGSMSSSISDYYYDFDENDPEHKTKMRLAEEAINVLLDQLRPDDSVGLVLFDNSAYLAKPLSFVGETDIPAIKEHVLEIKAMGGTNFEAGYHLANDVFEKYGIGNKEEFENRMIVITDAMPNVGEVSHEGLRELMEENAEKGIYTTFIGVGLDFNTEVVKNITDVRGANYYSVSSEEEFKTRMGEEFEFMVTPLVFDLNMDFESPVFEIQNVYGTDSINSETGNIMHVNTLFPSKANDDGEVRGGIIVLKLKKIGEEANDLKLKVTYETRDGFQDFAEEIVEFTDADEYYENNGIRKGILLARYVNLIKNWTEYERSKDDRYLITPVIGIIDYVKYSEDFIEDDYDYYYGYYSENERISVPLTVSDSYKEIFSTFKTYMESEIQAVEDIALEKEIAILNKILDS